MPFFDESKMLLIAFALMGLSTIALFFWFKQRISLVENKIETMFQLIQSHSEEPFEGSLDDPNFTMKESFNSNEQAVHDTNNNVNHNQNAYINQNLMDVSDNESSESDTDSDESNTGSDSDNNNNNIPIKTSSLDDLQNLNINKDNLVKLNFNDDNNGDSLDELDDNEDIDVNKDDNNIKQVAIEEITNYSILKVAELKNECKKKGLEGYSNLKKQELVELLNNNQ